MMGTGYRAICNQCGKRFKVSEGGRFTFHLLHCNRCGKSKALTFEKIGDPHLRYLKGLSLPYSIATQEHDKDIQKNYPGESISETEYHLIVENLAGKCRCGGHFRLKAQARCPNCKSKDFRKNPKVDEIMYD